MFKRRIKELTQSLLLIFVIWILIEHSIDTIEFNQWLKKNGINFLYVFLSSWIIFWFIFIKKDSKTINKKDNENGKV